MEKYIIALPTESDKRCALKQFFVSLDFLKQNKEFKTVDIQRYLKCGYGTAHKVLDALCDLCVIEKQNSIPKKNRCQWRKTYCNSG